MALLLQNALLQAFKYIHITHMLTKISLTHVNSCVKRKATAIMCTLTAVSVRPVRHFLLVLTQQFSAAIGCVHILEEDTL